MLSLAGGDVATARRWLRRARAVHITPELLALEALVVGAPRSAPKNCQ